MMVVIRISTENEAFRGSNRAPETARILRELAERIEAEGRVVERNLFDFNGNRVGAITNP